MKTRATALPGTLCVVALVAAGAWYARLSEDGHWPLAVFTAGGKPQATVNTFSVSRAEWSADGRLLLSISRGETGAEGTLALHDAPRWSGQAAIAVAGEFVTCASLAPDGLHALVGTAHSRLWWIDPTSRDPASFETASFETAGLVELRHPQSFTATAVARNGLRVAAGTSLGSIYLCDPAAGTSILLPSERQSSISDLHFSCDGKQLASARNDGSVAVWDLVNTTLLQEFAGHELPATTAEFIPGDIPGDVHDLPRIISAGMDDTIRIWDIADGRELWRGEFGLIGVTTLAVSADGKVAAWGGFANKVIVWDLERGRKQFEIITPASVVLHLSFSPDGTLLAVAGSETTIRLYDAATGAERDGIEIGRRPGN